MYRFNEKQKDKVCDLFFDTAKFLITGTVLVEIYQNVVGFGANAIYAGLLSAALLVICGLIIIGDKVEKVKGGKK